MVQRKQYKLVFTNRGFNYSIFKTFSIESYLKSLIPLKNKIYKFSDNSKTKVLAAITLCSDPYTFLAVIFVIYTRFVFYGLQNEVSHDRGTFKFVYLPPRTPVWEVQTPKYVKKYFRLL